MTIDKASIEINAQMQAMVFDTVLKDENIPPSDKARKLLGVVTNLHTAATGMRDLGSLLQIGTIFAACSHGVDTSPQRAKLALVSASLDKASWDLGLIS